MRQALLMLVAGAALGCVRPQPQQATAGSELQLALGGAARVSGGPEVTFEAVVEDSRCPIDAVCIQAGRATVRLGISHPDGDRKIELSIPEGATADTVHGHVVRLLSLLPPPAAAAPTPPDSYRVALLIDSIP
ncbi:MAG TPA: hypothetical protein VFT04_05585 [Gemmatimonadales bacterium]|nr:hypothetical protein [Gemmatimonadales bacterium]